MKIKLILFSLCLLFFNSKLLSAPYITSVPEFTTNGSTLTISGSAFGNKETASPVMWETFASGSKNPSWYYSLNQGGNIVVISSESINRPGTLCAEMNIQNVQACNFTGVSSMGETSEIYIGYWIRPHFTWSDTADDAWTQVKINRTQAASVGSVPNIYYEAKASELKRVVELTSTGTIYQALDVSTVLSSDTWHFLETEFVIGEATGTMLLRIDGVVISSQVLVDMSTTTMSTFGIGLARVRSNNLQPTDRYYMSEIYVDNTRAKVYLGNKPNFLDCTHLELQPINTWTGSSITVTTNLGSFNNEQVYLFVMDKDGAVSNGFPLNSTTPTIEDISGLKINGSTWTITGSNFGTKTTTAPVVWERFRSPTITSALNRVSILNTTNTTNLRTPYDIYNATYDFKNGADGLGYFRYDVATSSKWFVQYWIKLANNWHWGNTTFGGVDDGLANIKFFRLFPKGARNYTNLGYIFNNFTSNQTSWVTSSSTVHLFSEISSPWDEIIPRPMGILFSTASWHCVQVQYEENTGMDRYDGKVRLWIDGKLIHSSDTVNTNLSGDGVAVMKMPYIIGFYDSWPPSHANVTNMIAYYSDIYVDTTTARIEVGNNPVYNNCTHREIMLPTSWSGSTITAVFNQGTFSSTDTLYVFVTDENGTQSSGHLVDIPAVSNTSNNFREGSIVTIRGSGFGSHPQFSTSSLLNVAYNNFETGNVTKDNWYYVQGTTNGWRPTSTGNLPYFNGQHAQRFYKGVEPEAISINQTGTTGVWYQNFWLKLSSNTQSGKFWRIYGTGSAQNIWLAIGGSQGTSIRGSSERNDITPVQATVWGSPNAVSTESWHNIEIFMSQNPSTFSVYMDGKFQWGQGDWVYSPFGGNGHSIDIGHMIDNFDGSRAESSNLDGAQNFDNVYMDYSYARVIVATSAVGTQRSICVPLAWSDTEITCQFAQGGLVPGSTAQLIVYSSNNVASSAFDITLETDAVKISSAVGSCVNGSSVTLTGFNFGEGVGFSTQTELKDDFESGSKNPAWGTSYTTLANIANNNDNRHRYSLYASTLNFDNTHRKNFGETNTSQLSDKWYSEYRIKISTDWTWGTSAYGEGSQARSNIKIWRVWNPGSTTQDLFVSYDGVNNYLKLAPENMTADRVIPKTTSWRENFVRNEWYHFQFWFKENSAFGVADGEFRMAINGSTITHWTDVVTRLDGNNTTDGQNMKRIRILGFEDEWSCSEGTPDPICYSTNSMSIDELRVKRGTFKNVYLSTCSTLNACSSIETQDIVSWSTGSISFVVRPNALDNSKPLWVHVQREDFAVGSFQISTAPLPTAVTGQMVYGATIAITGMNFGTATIPLVWFNAEGGSLNPNGERGARSSWNANDNMHIISSGPALVGSTYVAHGVWDNAAGIRSFSFRVDKTTWTRIYHYQKRYFDYGPGVNQKFWRLYPSSGTNDYLAVYSTTNGHSTSNEQEPYGSGIIGAYQGTSYQANTWQVEEFYWSHSGEGSGLNTDGSPGWGNGYFKYTRNGVKAQERGNIDNFAMNHRQLRTDNFTDTANQFPTGKHVYMTNIWISSSPAHVVFSTSPRYSQSVVREIQPTLQWDVNKILVSANPGTLTGMTSGYAYVCDDHNVCNEEGTFFNLDQSVTSATIWGTPMRIRGIILRNIQTK